MENFFKRMAQGQLENTYIVKEKDNGEGYDYPESLSMYTLDQIGGGKVNVNAISPVEQAIQQAERKVAVKRKASSSKGHSSSKRRRVKSSSKKGKKKTGRGKKKKAGGKKKRSKKSKGKRKTKKRTIFTAE